MIRLIVFLLIAYSTVFALNENETAIKLHNIFNKKLILPLKLGADKTKALLNTFNSFSKETVELEDKLNDNLKLLKQTLLSSKTGDQKRLPELNNKHINILNKLNKIEEEKIAILKQYLNPKKLAYFFVIKEKLAAKFKKAVKIEELTVENN